MFQMRLSFATAFTSAYKSSDWTQKTIQIHEVLPLLTTVPTAILLELKVILYKGTQRQNTVRVNFEWERKENTCSIMQYKTERGYDC